MATRVETENGKSQRTADQPEIAELKDVAEAAMCGFRQYAQSRPEVVALWCLGIGFVLGWKLRPW